MTIPHNPNQNKLIAALPVSESKRLSPNLELVCLSNGALANETGNQLQHVYFPTTAIGSLQYVTESGATAEIACVGKEGILGIPLFMGGNATPTHVSIRTAGYAYRLETCFLMEKFNQAGSMRHMLLRYTNALITQTSQTLVCNQHHSVEQRLCRCLLLTLDRIASNEVACSKELFTQLFGARLDSVMAAVSQLQRSGLINYQHDRVEILNRSGLKDHACECYHLIKMEFDRLIGLDWDWRPMPESVKSWSRASMSIGTSI